MQANGWETCQLAFPSTFAKGLRVSVTVSWLPRPKMSTEFGPKSIMNVIQDTR